jgi:hypothetical protein
MCALELVGCGGGFLLGEVLLGVGIAGTFFASKDKFVAFKE